MATNAKGRALEIVQERRDLYDQKVSAGAAIPNTFHFTITRNGRKEHKVNWVYAIETDKGPTSMRGKQEFWTT